MPHLFVIIDPLNQKNGEHVKSLVATNFLIMMMEAHLLSTS